ncbi:hypothetical protein F4802DRAFT_575659 [Xylaria palmicola]|nr:hypothetical protein F4802DRAFT_575659 [Xylaria palmicola]
MRQQGGPLCLLRLLDSFLSVRPVTGVWLVARLLLALSRPRLIAPRYQAKSWEGPTGGLTKLEGAMYAHRMLSVAVAVAHCAKAPEETWNNQADL